MSRSSLSEAGAPRQPRQGCRHRGGERGRGVAQSIAEQKTKIAHTVDSDGDALGEHEAISADESRNLVKGVGLEGLGARLGGVGVNLLKLEVVRLRDGADGR